MNDQLADRFIPMRRSPSESFEVAKTYPFQFAIKCEDYCDNFKMPDSGVNFMQQYYRQNRYRNTLVETMITSPRRVLYFSPKQKSVQHKSSPLPVVSENGDFPVKSRLNPLIGKPNVTMDITEEIVSRNGRNQRMDWAANGFVTLIHDDSRKLLMHNPDTDKKVILSFGKNIEDCLKWNDDGTMLAVALRGGTVVLCKMESETDKMSETLLDFCGRVACFVFTGTLLIIGFCDGTICVEDVTNERKSKGSHMAHKKSIITMKVSCFGNYLATTGEDMMLIVWRLPDFHKIQYVSCKEAIILSVAWHPWKEPLLAIGHGDKKKFCVIWNVNSPKNLEIDNQSNSVVVDCLTFNPLSAELVISFWFPDRLDNETGLRHGIVVQKDRETIVDDLSLHEARVPYLLWDRKGERLATIGADETFAIWDFFGNAKNDFKTTSSRRPACRSIFDQTIR